MTIHRALLAKRNGVNALGCASYFGLATGMRTLLPTGRVTLANAKGVNLERFFPIPANFALGRDLRKLVGADRHLGTDLFLQLLIEIEAEKNLRVSPPNFCRTASASLPLVGNGLILRIPLGHVYRFTRKVGYTMPLQTVALRAIRVAISWEIFSGDYQPEEQTKTS